jgi:hypothetical protein
MPFDDVSNLSASRTDHAEGMARGARARERLQLTLAWLTRRPG